MVSPVMKEELSELRKRTAFAMSSGVARRGITFIFASSSFFPSSFRSRQHVGVGEGGGHGVDVYAELGELAGELAGHHDQASLGDTVVQSRRDSSHLAGEAAHHHDVALPLLLYHESDDSLGDEEGTLQVDGHDTIPLLLGDVQGPRRERDAGVVDEYVHALVVSRDPVDHLTHLVGLGDVGAIGRALRRDSLIAAIATRRFSSETSLTARTAPSFANAVATARPMPRAAPVTRTTLPSKRLHSESIVHGNADGPEI